MTHRNADRNEPRNRGGATIIHLLAPRAMAASRRGRQVTPARSTGVALGSQVALAGDGAPEKATGVHEGKKEGNDEHYGH
jgi:hypothetical protein